MTVDVGFRVVLAPAWRATHRDVSLSSTRNKTDPCAQKNSKGLSARSRAPHHARARVRRDRTPTRALFVATGRRPRAPARRAFNVERVCRLPTKRGHHGHFSGRAFTPPRPRTGLRIPPLSLSRRSPPLPFAVTVRFAPTFSYGVTRACLPRDALAAAPGP